LINKCYYLRNKIKCLSLLLKITNINSSYIYTTIIMETKKKLRKVNASRITHGTNCNTIHFICPFCFKNYKRDGTPRSNSKNLEHHHGLSDHELEQGYVQHRSPHCLNNRFPHTEYKSFKIIITPKTIIENH
jgi:hypothetical protein